jgi:hypothetical protein
MPAYARDGEVACCYRGVAKSKERYVPLGFNDWAQIDDGHLWPILYALTKLTGSDEAGMTKLVKRAMSR